MTDDPLALPHHPRPTGAGRIFNNAADILVMGLALLFSLPLDDIDQDKIDASFKNGVLNVTLPKSPTAQQVRRIAINGK
jgi:Hsp20/alpha crystallin family